MVKIQMSSIVPIFAIQCCFFNWFPEAGISLQISVESLHQNAGHEAEKLYTRMSNISRANIQLQKKTKQNQHHQQKNPAKLPHSFN